MRRQVSKAHRERTAGLAALVAVVSLVSLIGPGATMSASAEEGLQRRRPGHADEERPKPLVPAVRRDPAPTLVPLPDRWRIVEAIGVNQHWWDPYNQSTWKADRPIFGDDWFLDIGVISDFLVEPRRLPLPIGDQATDGSGRSDIFAKGDQVIVAETVLLELALVQGNTTFRPPDWEFRFVGAANINHVDGSVRGILEVDPEEGTTRTDGHLAIQELFVDRHLGNWNDDYDFVSLRVGIQEFISDYRGFLYEDASPACGCSATRGATVCNTTSLGSAAWRRTPTRG